jgi:hypothetical protein
MERRLAGVSAVSMAAPGPAVGGATPDAERPPRGAAVLRLSGSMRSVGQQMAAGDPSPWGRQALPVHVLSVPPVPEPGPDLSWASHTTSCLRELPLNVFPVEEVSARIPSLLFDDAMLPEMVLPLAVAPDRTGSEVDPVAVAGGHVVGHRGVGCSVQGDAVAIKGILDTTAQRHSVVTLRRGCRVAPTGAEGANSQKQWFHFSPQSLGDRRAVLGICAGSVPISYSYSAQQMMDINQKDEDTRIRYCHDPYSTTSQSSK